MTRGIINKHNNIKTNVAVACRFSKNAEFRDSKITEISTCNIRMKCEHEMWPPAQRVSDAPAANCIRTMCLFHMELHISSILGYPDVDDDMHRDATLTP